MSDRKDITRWNRAGLRRFRYVGANAATILEELRARLGASFPAWKALEPRATETPEERVLRQYRAPRAPSPDWGWEIARSFARACHVLVETIDAHANEGYLGTATEWESLRRIVAMIDHHPAPPASAVVALALSAKEDARGKVAQGLAVRGGAPDGGAPVTFETLEDVEVDAALNELRAKGWNRNPDPIATVDGWLELQTTASGLSIGEPLVLEAEAEGDGDGALSVHLITAVSEDGEGTRVRIEPGPPQDQRFTTGRTLVHAAPKDRLALLGPLKSKVPPGDVLRVSPAPLGLSQGDWVTITGVTLPGVTDQRTYRRAVAFDDHRITLDAGVDTLTAATATVSKAVELAMRRHTTAGGQAGSKKPTDASTVLRAPGNWSRLRGGRVANANDAATPREFTIDDAEYHPCVEGDPDGGYTVFTINAIRVDDAITVMVPPPGPGTWTVEAPVDLPTTGPIATDRPKSTSTGDLVVGVTRPAAVRFFARVASSAARPDGHSFDVAPDGAFVAMGSGDFWASETTVFGRFAQALRLRGWDENARPIAGTTIPLALEGALPEALAAGRRVIVESTLNPALAMLTSVAAVKDGDLTLADPLREDPNPSHQHRRFTEGSLVIRANVVVAGHGERRPERILGSGDAARSAQTFVLEEAGVSFVADRAQPEGVRPDIAVTVDGQPWALVPSFRGHGPTERIYVARLTEEGQLAIAFGDGAAGRRLPTGAGNVRIAYRVGAGLAGNVPAGSLVQVARQHPAIAAVRQPIAASGGNDREGVELLRTTAPASLLTLERAVSLGDFESLATSNSSVWQARALLATGAGVQGQLVEVVIVPAGGDPEAPLVTRQIEDYLRAHAVPGVTPRVVTYEPVRLKLDVRLTIAPEGYDPDAVEKAVRAALLDAFSLRRRKLAQPVWLAEVYAAVEATLGVASSRCAFRDRPTSQVLPASPRSVVALDPDHREDLGIDHEGSAR